MSGVEAHRDPFELQVSGEKLAPESDESLGEVEVPTFPSLAKPRMPSAFQGDPNVPGADRDAQGFVLREVPGGIEADDEPTGGVDAEEDVGEETEGISPAGWNVAGVREADRRARPSSPGAGGAQAEQEAAEARRPAEGILE
ncbi:MAG TPA: hypothetical protein P5164_12470 [Thermoanaerobaculia bacterium]|nr:hypothetical protein [Thermoanaerobaculia bacterium]